MGNKKPANGKENTGRVVADVAKANGNKVEARPIGEGKDPLSEGARLHNPTNTEAETHYKADNRELNDEAKASKIRGENANERAEEHNAEKPEDVEEAITEKAQDLHDEVTNRSEDDQAKEDKARSDALDKAAKTTDKK